MIPSEKMHLAALMAAMLFAFILASFHPADGSNLGRPAAGPGQVIVEEGRRSPPPPCSVSLGVNSAPLMHAGLPRNNPDGTYYSGDAFYVSLAVSSLNCTSTSTFVSADPGLVIACPGCTNTRIDISHSASPGSYAVRAIASGTGQGGSGYASAHLRVVVAYPEITVKVVPANVADADGYLMRNADDTHYINDAVALRYEVDYRFKDARRGVIEPEVTRSHPYPRIADLDCLQELCTHVVPATLATSEYRADFGYATGVSIANATTHQGLGQKSFQFDVRLKNAGIVTEMETSYTHLVSIVDYEPVFANAYPYLDLKAGGNRSYEKNLIVGLHYLGSSDADGTVEPLRRAKLNFYTTKVSALVVGTGSQDIGEQAGFAWLLTAPFTDGANDGSIVSQLRPGSDAVLERAGYAKVIMKMAKYSAGSFAKVQNVTASPAFYSKDFAGNEMLKLFKVAYAYPDAYFANTITAKVLDGNDIAATNVRLEVRPAAGSTVCKYYDKHAHFATGDPVFSKMALSDVYPCSAAVTEGGAGIVDMRANMTGFLIPKIYDSLYPGGLATLPAKVALALPSSMLLQLSVPDMGKVRTYDLALYAHDTDVELIANVGRDNVLYAVRDGAAVTVKSPENFGAIVSLHVNDIMMAQSCIDTCTLDMPHAGTIVATNKWGGRATASIAGSLESDSMIARMPAALGNNDAHSIIFAVLGAAGAAVAGVAVKRYISWMGVA